MLLSRGRGRLLQHQRCVGHGHAMEPISSNPHPGRGLLDEVQPATTWWEWEWGRGRYSTKKAPNDMHAGDAQRGWLHRVPQEGRPSPTTTGQREGSRAGNGSLGDSPRPGGSDDGWLRMTQEPLDGLPIGSVAQLLSELEYAGGTNGGHPDPAAPAVDLGVAVLVWPGLLGARLRFIGGGGCWGRGSGLVGL